MKTWETLGQKKPPDFVCRKCGGKIEPEFMHQGIPMGRIVRFPDGTFECFPCYFGTEEGSIPG